MYTRSGILCEQSVGQIEGVTRSDADSRKRYDVSVLLFTQPEEHR